MTGATAALPVHRLHDEDVERLLATGERRAELTALFGEAGYRELSALARRAAATAPPRRAAACTCCRASWVRASARAASCSTTCCGSTWSRSPPGT